MKPTLLSLLVAFVVGCGGGAQNTDPKQPEPAPAATPPAAKPADPPPPAATTIASDDDYIAKASALTTKIIDIFKADGKDCDKLADDLDKIQAEAAPLAAYEKDHPAAKAKLEELMKPRMNDMMSAVMPAMTSCQDNAHFKQVMSKQ